MTDEPRFTENSGEELVIRDSGPGEIAAREIESVAIYPYHRDPGYRPWLRKPGPPKPTHYELLLAVMEKHVDRAVIASRCSLVFAVILFVDLLLPKTMADVEVLHYRIAPSGTNQMELSDGRFINISKKAMRKMKGRQLTIASTRIFDVPYRMIDKENNQASFEISMWGNFIFGPIVLLLTSLFGILWRKGFELRFNLGVASAVVSMLNIAFLHVHQF